MRASKAATYGNGPLSVDDARDLAATELERLRSATGASAVERREMLEDLASRLSVLVTGLTEAEFEPLHDLVTVLEGTGGLDEKWTAAVETLTAFTEGADQHQPTGGKTPTDDGDAEARRKPFWKR